MTMRVLVGCEFSGKVRDAFREIGHEAWSCDLLPCEADGKWHIVGDVLDCIANPPMGEPWDMLLAFPPCTHLAVSGAAFFAAKRADGRQQAAIDFFMAMANANVPRIAIENPVGIMSTQYRKPDQIVQPWQFGHEATKATCLWLKGLPKLTPTNVVGKGEFVTYASGRRSTMWHAKSGSGSGHKRSVTYSGIAKAMAAQWGKL